MRLIHQLNDRKMGVDWCPDTEVNMMHKIDQFLSDVLFLSIPTMSYPNHVYYPLLIICVPPSSAPCLVHYIPASITCTIYVISHIFTPTKCTIQDISYPCFNKVHYKHDISYVCFLNVRYIISHIPASITCTTNMISHILDSKLCTRLYLLSLVLQRALHVYTNYLIPLPLPSALYRISHVPASITCTVHDISYFCFHIVHYTIYHISKRNLSSQSFRF